jgi:hypothetical protein
MKRWTVLYLALLVTPVHSEGESIQDRASKVKVRLEVLNNLGLNCDAELSVDGMKGANSEDCSKFVSNMRGDYFKKTMEECMKLSEWYESKRVFILANKNYGQTNPTEAQVLVKDMKAVNAVCNMDTMNTRYEYLMKPLNKINALSELQ